MRPAGQMLLLRVLGSRGTDGQPPNCQASNGQQQDLPRLVASLRLHVLFDIHRPLRILLRGDRVVMVELSPVLQELDTCAGTGRLAPAHRGGRNS